MVEELNVGDDNSAMYREDLARSNLNLKPILKDEGWDILDAQFWFRAVQDDHREDDGVHWNAIAHRWLTNIFLSHISAAWGLGWPKYPIPNMVEKAQFDHVPMFQLRNVLTEYHEASSTEPPS